MDTLESRRRFVLRLLAEPTDVNFGGKVHGGAVMKWIDQAGYACAVAWSGHYCVTACVGGIRFYKPIFIGQIVEVQAVLAYTGRSSMHIRVEVSATDPKTGARKKTAECLVVFVAIDEGGDTVAIPAWSPMSDEDKQMERHAMRMAELSRKQDVLPSSEAAG